jgi:hypothetical protein
MDGRYVGSCGNVGREFGVSSMPLQRLLLATTRRRAAIRDGVVDGRRMSYLAGRKSDEVSS